MPGTEMAIYAEPGSPAGHLESGEPTPSCPIPSHPSGFPPGLLLPLLHPTAPEPPKRRDLVGEPLGACWASGRKQNSSCDSVGHTSPGKGEDSGAGLGL